MASLIWQKTSLFDPHMTIGRTMKIPNTCCSSERHVQSLLRASIVYSWKCRCTSSNKQGKRNVVFRPSFDHSRKNENSSTLLHIYKTYQIIVVSEHTLYFRDMHPDYILENHLSIFQNLDRVPVIHCKNFTKKVFFGP